MLNYQYTNKQKITFGRVQLTDDEQDFVNYWMTQIDFALRYRKKYSDIDNWAQYRRWYRGDFRADGDMEDKFRVQVNKVFSYLRSMIPRVYFRNPSINITATQPEFVAGSKVLQIVDQWLVRKTNLKYHIKKAILDCGLCGVGPIKLGYDSEFGYLPEQGIDQNSGTVTQTGVKSGSKIEYNADIHPGMPWAARVRPEEVLVPFGYDNPRELPWVGHIVMRQVKDIWEDQKYEEKYRKVVKGGFSIQNDSSPKAYSFMQTGNKEDYALLYEIRDFKSGKMYVFCEDMPLLICEDTLQTDGLPWEFLIFNEDPEHFWGIPDVRMIAPQQKEINEIRSYASIMRKLNVIRILYTKGALKPEDLEKLLSKDIEDIGCGIEVDHDSIQASVQILNPANVSDNLIREQEQTETDFRDTLGVGQNQSGEFSPFHNKTATEATIVQQGSDIRSDERRDIVADLLTNIVRKFNMFIFKYWTTERVVEIAGADGQTYWVQFTGEQLAGEYAYTVNPEDSKPVDSATRTETATNLFQMWNGDPLVDQVGLRELVVDQAAHIDPAYKMLIRAPQPMALNTQAPVPGMPAGEGQPGVPNGMPAMQPEMQLPPQGPQQVNFEQLKTDPILRKQVLGV